CLQHCNTWVAETLDEKQCRQLALLDNPCLLYPDHPALPAVSPPAEAPGCLLVLDATWRKSLKMLYLNPTLASLPRFSLRVREPSRYHIRTHHKPHQLSTFEASCYALAQLEEAPQ